MLYVLKGQRFIDIKQFFCFLMEESQQCLNPQLKQVGHVGSGTYLYVMLAGFGRKRWAME